MSMSFWSRCLITFINLDKDVERRQRVEREFARLGLPGERFPAVWWADVPEAEQAKLYNAALNSEQYYKPLVNGEKGCYASHIHVWRKFLASESEWLVVLEDDVVLDDSFPAVVQAIAGVQGQWDMVKLMGRLQGEKVRARRPLTPQHDLIAYQRVPSMTAGYVLSREGARKLLQSRIPFGRPIDVDLRFWWENDLTILGVLPPVVLLDETSEVSSIEGVRPPVGWLMRWRKIRMKAALTLGNMRHLAMRAKTLD